MSATTIEWTDEVWNPTTGCDRVSPGCDRCYALPMAKRLKAMENTRIDLELLPLSRAKYQADGDPRTSGPGFGIAMHPDTLTAPFSWHKPRKVFVNSMSDLFHKGVSDEFIADVFAVMIATPQHTYQVLTKRAGRMRSLLSSDAHAERVAERLAKLWKVPHVAPLRGPVENIWLGVSVEDQKRADLRIPALLDTPAAVRFLSCEPLLGPVNLDQPRCEDHGRIEVVTDDQNREWCGPCAADGFTGELSFGHWLDPLNGGVDWVIVGGESGHGARPMHPNWVRTLRDQCDAAGVPFFFKQWGEWGPAPWRVERADGEPVEAYKARAEATGATHAYAVWADDYGHETYEPTSKPWSAERTSLGVEHAPIRRWGKKAAGRELDGRVHDGFPERAA